MFTPQLASRGRAEEQDLGRAHSPNAFPFSAVIFAHAASSAQCFNSVLYRAGLSGQTSRAIATCVQSSGILARFS